MVTLSAVRDAAPDEPVDPDLPVICLGRKGDELAELRALRAGADDHVRKPVHYPLLPARIEALLRRRNAAGRRGRVRIGALYLDASARIARVVPGRVPAAPAPRVPADAGVQQDRAVARRLGLPPPVTHPDLGLTRVSAPQ